LRSNFSATTVISAPCTSKTKCSNALRKPCAKIRRQAPSRLISCIWASRFAHKKSHASHLRCGVAFFVARVGLSAPSLASFHFASGSATIPLAKMHFRKNANKKVYIYLMILLNSNSCKTILIIK
jgi:hypothetical protein